MPRTVYLQHTEASQGCCQPTNIKEGSFIIRVHNVPDDVTNDSVARRLDQVVTWKVGDVEWADCKPGAIIKG